MNTYKVSVKGKRKQYFRGITWNMACALVSYWETYVGRENVRITEE